MVTITTQDNVQIELETKFANQFGLIKNMIEDIGDNSQDLNIPVTNISSETIYKAIDYLKYSEEKESTEDTKEEKSNNDKLNEDLKFFDYVKLEDVEERNKLFQVILAANYLCNENLLNLGCKKVAEYLKGKTSDEIKTFLGIP
jgi:S-phase kinase-associated protein 1